MQDQPVTAAVVKATPPVAVTAANYLFSMPIEKWLTAITIVYVLLQMFFLVRDRIGKKRDKK